MSDIIQYMGIDPGKAGAVAFMLGDAYTVEDMPIIKHKDGKDELNIIGIYDLLRNTQHPHMFAVIEEQQVLTRFDKTLGRTVPQGAVSNFTLGYGYGILKTILEILQIPYCVSRPKDWQKLFGITKGKQKDIKSQSHDIAKKLFPQVYYETPRGKILDGRSDAMLICQFAKYLHGKISGNPISTMEIPNDQTSKDQKLPITRRHRRPISART